MGWGLICMIIGAFTIMVIGETHDGEGTGFLIGLI